MTKAVLDASALLALLNTEVGADLVEENLQGAIISSVNLAEVVAKLCISGVPARVVRQIINALGLKIMPFDEEQAYEAGLLSIVTRDIGLSLGDRACLSLGKLLGTTVLTADKSWSKISTGIKIKLIR